MARALLAWEFGGDLGHARRAVAIARQLRALGHDIGFAFPDLAALDPADAGDIVCVPTPHLPLAENLDASPLSASHVLLNLGYINPVAVAGAFSAWRGIFGLLRPDVVVCDYAPTALLAARAAGVPRLALGSGFSMPPVADPMPSLRSWAPSEPALLAKLDAALLASVRQAWSAAYGGAAPVSKAGEVFAADAQLVCAWPELDHFGVRGDVEYLGPQRDIAKAAEVHWQSEARPRIFAYLKPRDPRFKAILEAIGAQGGEAIVAAPGITDADEAGLPPTIRILRSPVDVDAMAGADLWVSHASAGIAAAGMRLGVPHALLPLQLEQYMVARRAAEQGFARLFEPAGEAPDLAGFLAASLADGALRQAAAHARDVVAERTPVCVGERIARALER